MVDGRASNNGRNPSKGPGTIFIQRHPKLVKITQEPGMVAHSCYPSTQEAEPGGSEFEVVDQLGLYNENLSKGGEEGEKEEEGKGKRSRGTSELMLDRSWGQGSHQSQQIHGRQQAPKQIVQACKPHSSSRLRMCLWAGHIYLFILTLFFVCCKSRWLVQQGFLSCLLSSL